MPTVDNLICRLHTAFGDNEVSVEQQRLMDALQQHIHNFNQEDPVDPDLEDTLTILLNEVESQHPQVAIVIRETMEMLKNIGV